MFPALEYSRGLTLVGIYAVIDITMCVNVVHRSFEYGPSIAAIPKVIVTGEPLGSQSQQSFPFAQAAYEHRIELKDYPSLSVLIPIANNTYKASTQTVMTEFLQQNTFDIQVGFGINFTVLAPRGFRVMATVQTLNLFHNQLDTECGEKQFLQFGKEPGEVTKICGIVDLNDNNVQPSTLFGPRSYRSKGDKLPVSFRFADFSSYLINGPFRNAEVSLSVSFTAFQDKLISENGDITKESLKNLPQASHNLYSCSSPSEDNEGTFIDASLFCDGVMNCGSSDDIGYDENHEVCEQVASTFAVSSESTSEKVPRDRHLGLGSLDSTYYGNDNAYPFPTYPSHSYSATTNINSYSHDEDVFNSTLSPPTTILVIVFVVVVVMLVGTIIRFCCTKCVGIPPQVPTISLGTHDPSFDVATLGENGLPIIVSHQCSRVNFANDFPPSYEELFPSWKLNLSDYNEGGNVNPSFEGDSVSLSTRATEGTTVVQGKNSSANNSHVSNV